GAAQGHRPEAAGGDQAAGHGGISSGRSVATDPRQVPAWGCCFPGQPFTKQGPAGERTEHFDSPGAQISDGSIAAARAGPIEGLLISLRLRLDDRDRLAMAWTPAEEIPACNPSLAIRMTACLFFYHDRTPSRSGD